MLQRARAGPAAAARHAHRAAGHRPAGQAPTAEAEKDQCGLKEAQAFVGKPRTSLPAPVDPSRWRVACTTCPVTMDYRADRLNILFNADTGVVQEVKCG